MASIDFSAKSDQSSVSDEKQLVPTDDEEGVKEFAKFYTNCCPGRFLRTTNWVLLIALLISSIYGAVKPINWHDHVREWERVPVAVGVCLTLLAMSKLYRRRSSTNAGGVVGVMDFCFALLSMVILLIVALFYGVHCTDLYNHFYPKLFGANATTLAELTGYEREYHQFPSIYRPYHHQSRYLPSYDSEDRSTTRPSTTTTTTTERPFSAHELEIMEGRRQQVLFHLVFVPANMIFAIVLIIVNLLVAVSICIAFKRSNIWISDLRKSDPICSEFDAKYSKFWPYGLVNIAFWVIPTMAGLLCIFTGAFTRSAGAPIVSAIAAMISFTVFLQYVQKANIRGDISGSANNNNGTTPSRPKLLPICITYVALSVASLIFYMITLANLPYYMREGIYFCIAGIALCTAQLLLLLMLNYQCGGICSGIGGAYFGIPQISIQISVNVNKNNAKNGGEQQDAKMVDKSGENEKNGQNVV